MSNDIAKFFDGHQPPSAESLVDTLSQFASAKSSMMGKALLKLTKQGVWVFGMDSEPLEDGTELVVHPASFASGYIAWNKGQIEDERMQPLTQGPVDPSTLSQVLAPKGWESQVGMELMLQDGDTPLHLMYKTTSKGGTRAVLDLAGKVAFGLTEQPGRAYPVIALGVTSYQHKEYGKVYTPVFNLVNWLDEAGEPVKTRPSLT